MITISLKTELKLKDSSTVYPIGTVAELSWDAQNYSITIVKINGRALKIRTTYIPRLFCTPKIPSVGTMSKWEADRGVCKSVLGNVVEPDGIDEFGSPSWMLVL